MKRKSPKLRPEPAESDGEFTVDEPTPQESAMDCSEEDAASDNVAQSEPDDDVASDNEANADDGAPPEKRERKKKHGIIYLSTIPKHMTVAIAREMFGQYAAVGRMFFQPAETSNTDGKWV